MKGYSVNVVISIAITIALPACISQQMNSMSSLPDREGLSFDIKLHTPERQSPYPVIIDLHGCNGIWEQRDRHWLPFFLDRGFAVLQVDSFTRRGYSNICNDVFKIAPMTRTLDVAHAVRLILKDPQFDSSNIFLLGYSHGGTTVLLTNMYDSAVFSRIRGAIAYYPYCLDALPVLNMHLLILIGEHDDWTPANECRRMRVIDNNRHRLDLIVYPNTYHTFDVPGLDARYYGHRVLYNPKAAAASFEKVKSFLREHQSQ